MTAADTRTHTRTGVESLPLELQRYVTQLREVEMEARGVSAAFWTCSDVWYM